MHYNAHQGLWIFTYFVQYTKDLLTFKSKYTIAMQQKLSQKLTKESKKYKKEENKKEKRKKIQPKEKRYNQINECFNNHSHIHKG